MKRLAALMLLISALYPGASVCAQADEPTLADSCVNRYLESARQKHEWQLDDGSWAAIALLSPAVVLVPLAPVVGVPYFFLAGAASGAMLTDDKELRALSLMEPSARPAQRLLRKARKKRPDVTEEEISALVRQGFESGEFCKHEKLASPRQIRNYVLERISL
ncbi:MAG: hypothetical protein HYW49_02735 [Deltaproteobacteria bacterium]|nr:hypothetical protein [Deltaproteobacteria bacterium]